MDVKSYDLSIEYRDQTDDKGELEMPAFLKRIPPSSAVYATYDITLGY